MNSVITKKPGGGEDKLLGIELLRFASAVAVLVFHYQHLAFVGTQQVNFDMAKQPFYSMLSLFYTYGFHGVQVFWCISGFIFFWKYGESVSRKKLGGYSFFILRASRLYPLHFVTLVFVAALQLVYYAKNNSYFVYTYNDAYHFFLQLFMASNWGLQAGDSFNGPIWSISIEVLIYCVFFLSLRYISGSPPFIAFMALASAAIVFLKLSTHWAFSCAMFFYLGCFTAIVYMKVKDTQLPRRIITIGCVLSIAGLLALNHFITVKPMYFLLLFSPALIFLCTAYIRPAKFGARFLAAAGNVTYSSYLLHVPIQLAIATYCSYAHATIPFYNPLFFLLFMGVTLLLSLWCYEYFEMPAQRLMRKKFKASVTGTPAVARSQSSPIP